MIHPAAAGPSLCTVTSFFLIPRHWQTSPCGQWLWRWGVPQRGLGYVRSYVKVEEGELCMHRLGDNSRLREETTVTWGSGLSEQYLSRPGLSCCLIHGPISSYINHWEHETHETLQFNIHANKWHLKPEENLHGQLDSSASIHFVWTVFTTIPPLLSWKGLYSTL